jgi:hypothetical protein
MFIVENILENPDVQVFDKLKKKAELLSRWTLRVRG